MTRHLSYVYLSACLVTYVTFGLGKKPRHHNKQSHHLWVITFFKWRHFFNRWQPYMALATPACVGWVPPTIARSYPFDQRSLCAPHHNKTVRLFWLFLVRQYVPIPIPLVDSHPHWSLNNSIGEEYQSKSDIIIGVNHIYSGVNTH